MDPSFFVALLPQILLLLLVGGKLDLSVLQIYIPVRVLPV